MDTVLATMLGVAASLAAWFVVTHVIRPKVDFEPLLCMSTLPSGRLRYRLKFINARRLRGIQDVRVLVRLHLRGLARRDSASNLWTIIDIPVDDDYTPLVNRRGKSRWQRPVFQFDGIDPSDMLNRYEPHLAELAGKGEITLDQLTSTAQQFQIVAYVACTDGFSGSRRVFRVTIGHKAIVPDPLKPIP